jgi:hypothetical protein
VRYISIFIIALTALSLSCKASLKLSKDGETSSPRSEAVAATVEEKTAKLTSEDCIDPDLSWVGTATQLMLCDGTIASGTYTPDFPDAGNVLTTDTVNGNSGTYTPPSTCASDGETGCVTDVSYPAAEVASIDSWDLRVGTSLGGVDGALKLNCRNMVGVNYDKTGGLSTGISGVNDPFSTIDDFNGAAAADGNFNTPPYPTTNPWGSAEHLCGFSSIAVAEQTWELVTASGDKSVYKDKISGIKWSRGDSVRARDWDNIEGGANDDTFGGDAALEYCNVLDHSGIGPGLWRLPTQKELMAAYEHGIHDLDDGHTATDNLGDLDGYFWSSSTWVSSNFNAWYLELDKGVTGSFLKTQSFSVLCVAP